MMHFSIYDTLTGEILRSGSAPNPVDQIADDNEDWIAGEVDPSEYYVREGEAVPYPPRPNRWCRFNFALGEWFDPRTPAQLAVGLENAKALAIAQTNETRGAARMRFITALPGQDMVYIEKEREARDWVAARASGSNAPDPADYPHLSREVGVTAPDMDAVAQVYLNMAAMFRVFSAVIEGEAMAVLAEVEAAPTAQAASAAAQAFPLRLLSALAAAGALVQP